MRPIIAAVLALFVFVRPAAADVAPPPEVLAEQDLREATLAYFESFNAASVDGLAGMFSDRTGVKFLENGRVAYADKAAMRAAFAEAFATMPGVRTEISGEIDVMVLSPDAGATNSAWTVYMPDGFGKEEKLFSGMTTLVFAREPDGWRIVTGHASGPLPDARGEAAGAAPAE